MTTRRESIESLAIDGEAVEALKQLMLAETRGYRLRELREDYGMTQEQLAKSANISLRQVEQIERGDVASMQLETLRRCVEALGASLRVEVELGDTRYRLA